MDQHGRRFVVLLSYRVADLGEGPEGTAALFWVNKKKSEKEEKPAVQAKQNRHPPTLSSSSGSATGTLMWKHSKRSIKSLHLVLCDRPCNICYLV